MIPMSRQHNSQRLVVLVVEDEWLVREAIVNYLQGAGCRVLEAASGEDALSVLEREQAIDVLLTDIRLNGCVNGWEVGEAFRHKHADKPVIYASGHSIEPPRQVPGSLFFNKPYNPSEILDACQQLTAAGRTGTVGD
jgi:CheY-like chemotaxis protein